MTLVLMSTVLVMQGGLLSDFSPRAGMLVAAVEDTKPAALPKLDGMTLEQLEAERLRVEASVPSVLLPAICFGVGGGVFLVGAGFFLFSSMVVGGVMFAIAAPIIVAGIVLLLINGPARTEAGTRLREIKRLKVLLQQREQNPGFDLPPMPPPPGVQRDVEPSLMLATF